MLSRVNNVSAILQSGAHKHSVLAFSRSHAEFNAKMFQVMLNVLTAFAGASLIADFIANYSIFKELQRWYVGNEQVESIKPRLSFLAAYIVVPFSHATS
ncbi:hypothetical protein POVWA2_011200 [Plasmodium ovale wallikeri]|uniref:Uncharacterized protein n=1 Tax=Plasmodium ovale wallikeri TaxID=864142 RepID=A0A1A8YMG9_PLAOA|nr:hypothetical protein POVWA2_011200 [Plasmodium ovale wallikeri]